LCTVRVFLKQKIKQRNNTERGSSFDFERMAMRYLHRSRAEEVGREDLHEPPLPSAARQIRIREVNVFNGSATSNVALTRNFLDGATTVGTLRVR
jgi:hypothetical protein